MIQKGDDCNVLLTHRDSSAEYARAPITDAASVEKCVDSSRYFVIRCVNPNPRVNQKLFIGIAFNERNDAFEFNVALQEYQKYRLQKRDLAKAPNYEDAPTLDMSIKDGEKIKVRASFASSAAARRRKQGIGANLVGGSGSGLAPPAKDTPSRRQIEALSDTGSLAPNASAGAALLGCMAPTIPAPHAVAAPVAPTATALSVPLDSAKLSLGASNPPQTSIATVPSDPFAAVPSTVGSDATPPDPFAPPPMEGVDVGGVPSDPFAPQQIAAFSETSGLDPFAVSGNEDQELLSMKVSAPRTGLETGLGKLCLGGAVKSTIAVNAFGGIGNQLISSASICTDPFAGVPENPPGAARQLGVTGGQSGSQFDSLGGLPNINAGVIEPSDPFSVPTNQEGASTHRIIRGLGLGDGVIGARAPSVMPNNSMLSFSPSRIEVPSNAPLGMGAFDDMAPSPPRRNDVSPVAQPAQDPFNNLF